MEITADEIRAKVASLWPDLEYIWLWDKTFWMPPLGAVDEALKGSNVPTMQFIDSFNDCDDFALQFVAEVRRKRYLQWASGKLPKEHQFPISIGRAFGDMFRGISKVHMACLCLCQEGVYILDATPGERRIWEAKPENDNLIYVDM